MHRLESALELSDSPRPLRPSPLHPAEHPRPSMRLADRILEMRGSGADALVDSRTPRSTRWASATSNVDVLDLPPSARSDTSRTDLHMLSDTRLSAVDLGPSSPPVATAARHSPKVPPAMQHVMPRAAPLTRDTIRKPSPLSTSDYEIRKGFEKEVRKLIEQEDQQLYKRAIFEDGEAPFAILPATPGGGGGGGGGKEEKKNKKKGAIGKPLLDSPFGSARALLMDLVWNVGAFAAALIIGLVLLRLERGIRALANRSSLGKLLGLVWAKFFHRDTPPIPPSLHI